MRTYEGIINPARAVESARMRADARARWVAEQAALPKRPVRLTITLQRLTWPGRPGVGSGVVEFVPPGTEMDVTEEEYARFQRHGWIDQKLLERLTAANATPAPTRATLVEIGDTFVSMDEIVSSVLSGTATTPAEWNALSDEDREQLIDAEISRRMAALAEAKTFGDGSGASQR
jgi:hypothetical protein